MTEDGQQQEDECVALASIFGPEIFRRISPVVLEFGIPSLHASPSLHLRLMLPTDYPSASPPVLEMHSDLLDIPTIASFSRTLESMFDPGLVVIYNWVAWLQEEWMLRVPPPPVPPPLQASIAKVANAESIENSKNKDTATQEQCISIILDRIIHGEPLTEKKSTFQAHVAIVKGVEEVQAVVDALLTNNKIRAATHNIMAYRIEREDALGTFLQDCDDDGEAMAGGRLLHLLQVLDARNVVVVVSRWFGGVLLGPLRFGLINKVAAELLDRCGYSGKHRGGAALVKKGNKKKQTSSLS